MKHGASDLFPHSIRRYCPDMRTEGYGIQVPGEWTCIGWTMLCGEIQNVPTLSRLYAHFFSMRSQSRNYLMGLSCMLVTQRARLWDKCQDLVLTCDLWDIENVHWQCPRNTHQWSGIYAKDWTVMEKWLRLWERAHEYWLFLWAQPQPFPCPFQSPCGYLNLIATASIRVIFRARSQYCGFSRAPSFDVFSCRWRKSSRLCKEYSPI